MPAFATSRSPTCWSASSAEPMVRSSQAKVEVHCTADTGSPAAPASALTPASEASESASAAGDPGRRGEVAGAVRHQHQLVVGQHHDVLLDRGEVGREPGDQVGAADPGAAGAGAAAGSGVAEPAQRPLDAGHVGVVVEPEHVDLALPGLSERLPLRVEGREPEQLPEHGGRLRDAGARGQVAVVGPAQERRHLPLGGPGPERRAPGLLADRLPVGVRRPQRRARQRVERVLVGRGAGDHPPADRHRPPPPPRAGRPRRPRHVCAPGVHPHHSTTV